MATELHSYHKILHGLNLTCLFRERLCGEGEPEGDGGRVQRHGQHHHPDIPQGETERETSGGDFEH